jgi:hypothetical protein
MGKNHLEDEGADVSIILNWILRKQRARVWNDSSGSWEGLMVGSKNNYWTFWFHIRQGITPWS